MRINAVAPAAIETRMYEEVAATPEMKEMFAAAHPIGRGMTGLTATTVGVNLRSAAKRKEIHEGYQSLSHPRFALTRLAPNAR